MAVAPVDDGYVMMNRFVAICLLIVLALMTIGAGPGPERAERIALAAYRNGQWDLYTIAPDGSDPRQLTDDPYIDTDPLYSPDGNRLAFASRRENNWDVYILDLRTGQIDRLTDSPHYDGAPAWSPDGSRLAFESQRAGNLDIWLTDGHETANLTANDPAGNFAPAWHPQTQTILFTGWQAGNKELYRLDLADGQTTRLTDTPAAEEGAAWHPAGEQLALTVDELGRREVFTLGRDQSRPQPLTWLGRSDGAAWSPAGDQIAVIFHRWDGEIIATQSVAERHPQPRLLTPPITLQGRLSWHKAALNFGRFTPSLVDPGLAAPYEERLSPNEGVDMEPYNLVRLDDLQVGTPWLADTVDDSFRAWRIRLRDEVGYDFLAQLSDALRDAGSYSETSQYASWHKSGRAIDTLFDYHVDGALVHEIVKEVYSGETFWRVYLRCADQSGQCGRPLTATPWNYSRRARTELAPDQGGVEKANLTGYYVDMTGLAREYGWRRISSHDDEDYSWTWHFLAFEYWHYQKPRFEGERMNWYAAMTDVYPPETIENYFNWQKMHSLGEDPHLIALKGVPLPLERKPWWALVEQP